ncbi:hypothetical protein KDW99_17960 [Marinomonas rhizomae]|uniref:complement resistance protein TraT n=1 Tax=Marinomonas rhizomae TaxID=491948 RepID=UPI0021038A0D|nr:complement resistance protein TraT [Marinomonas rhizomae]UTV99108.1 hypothetical protein KDW99_17960 [Marinomonas rhizomae]
MKLPSLLAKIVITGSITASLVGCSAINTSLNKQDLVVDSRLSHSIVLEPVSPSNRIVYARIRDVSGNGMRSDMQKMITQHLTDEGFVVTDDPNKANLMLNATIISAAKTSIEQANALLSSGYKGGIEGAAIGAGVSSVSGGSGSDIRQAGLFAGAAGFFADAIVEDAYFTFVMDVQMRERALAGDSVSNSTQNKSIKGISTGNAANLSVTKSSVERGDDYNWIIYETRIVTTANQMNLKMEEALPAVQERTALSLSELML